MKISKIHTIHLRNDEHFQFHTEFRDLATKGWAAELQTLNNAFSGLMKERFDETASRCDIVLREARAELDQSYFAIREKINALVIVEGAADYENFIRTLNAVVAKYTAILNSRLGKRGKKETENTQTNGGSV